MHHIHTILSLLAASLLSMTAVTTPAAASDASLPAPPRTLVFLNWSEYLDPELVEEFEQRFNAKVSEVYFESDDLRDDMMVETGALGYDLVIVNGINVDSYRKRGWIAPLDEAALPNLKYVDKHWRNAFESGNGYGVPYFWGTLGIAYRQDLVEQAPASWMDLLQPAESLRGKIGMVENSRDLLGMALKALGHSANSTDPAATKAAEQLLLAQKPYVKTYNYLALTEESALVSGDIVVTADRLRGATVFLGGPFGSTVLGTANVMSAATLAEGTTVIECAACEPEVVDLARLLMGDDRFELSTSTV